MKGQEEAEAMEAEKEEEKPAAEEEKPAEEWDSQAIRLWLNFIKKTFIRVINDSFRIYYKT
jgi:hypothetical protein